MKIPTQLKSRKFWLTVGAFIILVANGEFSEAVWIVLGYLGVEGGADVVERYQGKQVRSTGLDMVDAEEEIDRNNLISGNQAE